MLVKNMSALTTKEFIKKAKEVHGDKYDYSKVEYVNTLTPVTIVCPEHGEFEQIPKVHLKGCGCKKCANKGTSDRCRGNIDEFIKKSKEVHGDKYDYSKVDYVNSQTKVCIICHDHGEFWQKPANHLQGQGCPACGNVKQKTTEEFIKEARKIHGDKYDYSKVQYVNNKSKVCIICPEHGEFLQSPAHHLNGFGCPKCSKNYKLTTEEFIEKSVNIYGDRYDYSKVNYVNNKTKVSIICPDHGEFKIFPKIFLKGLGCVKCRYVSDTNTFIEKAKKIHRDKYYYSKTIYKDNKDKICIICPEHGEFWQSPHDHLDGCGCPNCSHSTSNPEFEIFQLIKTLKPLQNDRTILNGKELDIYVPSKKLAIEYNGLHWHSERFGKGNNYHLDKLNNCIKQGIKLIQIFEDEWILKKNICKSKILQICGLNMNPKLYGRKCVIKEIWNKEDAYAFLDKNHIQGKSGFSIGLGAYYEDRLIAVMTFINVGANKFELNRFASDIRYLCIGVGGKLFKHFLRNYDPIEIKSFADRRWTVDEENNIYIQLGFEFCGYTKPSYTYYNHKLNKLERVHKFNYRKQILHKKYGLPLTMTESEMANELGSVKIWDCGLIKYVWKKV